MNPNQKLSFFYIVAHIRRATVFTFNAAQHYYGTRTLSRGYCISAAVTDLSPFNATDRRRIRRVANAMLHACDCAEIVDDMIDAAGEVAGGQGTACMDVE